jgi:acyl-CoA synthetase (AMP-forming)/AMP-acid ligase II
LKDCKVFEQNFAGIVLGRCVSGITAKIVRADGSRNIASAIPLSLGYFGEIVYGRNANWHRTGFYGFIDHRDRVWCCGKIEDSIYFNGEYFYPYCIEPVFETLFFVKRARLAKSESGAPTVEITLRPAFGSSILKRHFLERLRSFASRFEKTKKLAGIKVIDPH